MPNPAPPSIGPLCSGQQTAVTFDEKASTCPTEPEQRSVVSDRYSDLFGRAYTPDALPVANFLLCPRMGSTLSIV